MFQQSTDHLEPFRQAVQIFLYPWAISSENLLAHLAILFSQTLGAYCSELVQNDDCLAYNWYVCRSRNSGSKASNDLSSHCAGTSSGFGRELVLIALERGDRVIATGRSLDKIQDFPKSDNIRTLELDLDWDTKSIKDKVDEAVAFWGYIDVIVNNAGFGKKGLIEEVGYVKRSTTFFSGEDTDSTTKFRSEGFKEQFQTNFFGLINVTNAVLPHMRARRSGTLVMLGSRTSWTPEYSVSLPDSNVSYPL